MDGYLKSLMDEIEIKRKEYLEFDEEYRVYNTNNGKLVNAYHEWYYASLPLFEKCFPSDNKCLVEFKNVETSSSVLTLRNNYEKILAAYIYMLNLIKQEQKPIMVPENNINAVKPSLLFVSHSSKDVNFAEAFVRLLQTLGFNKSNLFCSSVEGYGIDEGSDIYDTLRDKFQEYTIYVVFILSKHYYESPACLNEMGAAWVLQSDYSTIIVPGCTVRDIKGAINANKLAIVIDDEGTVRSRLNSFKTKVTDMFSLSSVDDEIVWEKNRSAFLSSVRV
ncbi:toll/interleukin-1 receptor domain-containing protein [Porphyromonas gulae]|uniref:toll/interleukin-1 receptor domain-containing protein n=1 Tax=Porphyromonas gulae TaxID=111105 RepID=UPI000AE66B4E|nr:toll/interleukin-1 receptor domain-containing protein [Porphyromonas gulae]